MLIYLTFNIKSFVDTNALVAQLVEQLICNQMVSHTLHLTSSKP